VPALFPHLIPFNTSLAVASIVLLLGLVGYLGEIGWDVVQDDIRHPKRTAALMLGARARGQRT
jgi:hypothetical protein